MVEPVECNLPFGRVPTCACDPGNGPAPTKQKMLECELSGGPCSPRHLELHPEAGIARPEIGAKIMSNKEHYQLEADIKAKIGVMDVMELRRRLGEYVDGASVAAVQHLSEVLGVRPALKV